MSDPQFSLDEIPGFLIRKLDARAQALFHKHAEGAGLTTRQVGVLMTLSTHGAMSQADLCRSMSVDKSTLGEMAKRMNDKGLIERRSDEGDRRSAQLDLTELGRSTLAGVLDQVRAAQRELLSPLPEEYHATFIHWLKRLTAEPGDDRSET